MPQATTSEAAIALWQRLWYTRLRDALRGRFDASLDWRREIADADLPEELKHVVRQTVRSTRLWRGEKVDIARELVTHFQDGLQRGHQVSALATSFGDPQQSARLIRRAKQRCRPLAWHVWHYGWMTVAGLILVYVLVGLYMMTGRPEIKTDYLTIVNERAESVPEAERAWPLYRQALLAMGAKVTELKDKTNQFAVACESSPGDGDWAQAEQFLTEHQDSIAELRVAAARRELGLTVGPSWRWFAPEDRALLLNYSPDTNPQEPKEREKLEDRWLISTLLPHMHILRSTGGLLRNDCRRAVAAGDGETALADIFAMSGVSQHAEESPFMVNLLVSSAIERMSDAAVREAFAARPKLWSEAQLRNLAHRLAAAKIDWRRGYEGESACFYDTMQRLYTDNGRGDGRLAFKVTATENVFGMLNLVISGGPGIHSILAQDGFAMLALPAANMVVASRKEMTDAYLGFINSALAKIETPLWKQPVVTPENEILSDQAGAVDRYRYLFIRLLLPAFDAFQARIVNAEGERDGVLVGIALELYHREHDAWPKTLDELSPRWLPAVPVDRYTGEPLHYKIVDDRPVVYSVGVDRDDDGGRVPPGINEVDLASESQFSLTPPADGTHDGDWVIWSTAPSD